LSESEAAALIGAIVDGSVTSNQAAGILIALAGRGEYHEEIAGAARAMRERCIAIDHDLPVLVDVVGTGGDGKGTINISTMAALVVAASGLPVAKHGNRAASSACGSADVLEAAGLPLDLAPETCARMLRETNFTFLFAPQFHPSMRAVAQVRRELGVPTIFNLLGPLTNPARPTHHVIGVATRDAFEVMARVFDAFGMLGAVVLGSGGLDEVAGEGVTYAIEFNGGEPLRREIDPESFGVRTPVAELSEQTRDACVDAFFSILGGERSGRADVVALNAAVAIATARNRATLREAFVEAREVLASGEPLRLFRRCTDVAYA
jgi:anthranilate phosphoribosyltransferase